MNPVVLNTFSNMTTRIALDLLCAYKTICNLTPAIESDAITTNRMANNYYISATYSCPGQQNVTKIEKRAPWNNIIGGFF